MRRRIVALLLSGLMLALSACGCTNGTAVTSEEVQLTENPENHSETAEAVSSSSEERAPGHDYLGEQLSESAYIQVFGKYNGIDYYSEMDYTPGEVEFPETFDLRDKGVILDVRDQSPWGSCWSFATMAACESSILSTLGLTADEYEKKYGEELNLSEKHLAYFANLALPEEDEYPEGEYPYEVSQAGEGCYYLVDSGVFDVGGFYQNSVSALSAGIGLNYENDYPYCNSEGEISRQGDWSIDEEERFKRMFSLKNANVLPAPALYENDEKYVYNPAGTEAIKSELMKGRGVGISYYADTSTPVMNKEDTDNYIKDTLNDFPELDEEYVKKLFYFENKQDDGVSYTEDDLKGMIRIRLLFYDLEEDTYDLDSLSEEDLWLLVKTQNLGQPVDDIRNKTLNTFINNVDGIWSQYTYEELPVNHSVCVVGWDDGFPKELFLEGHEPPEDGAWLVRNSWGEGWGMGGYFYLSYYDKTITLAQSFEFLTESELFPTTTNDKGENELYIPEYEYCLENDFMGADQYNSTLFTGHVLEGNVFDVDEAMDMYSVSVLTGELNTEVNVDIYRLNDNPKNPTDGELVGSVSDDFTYSGYHRILLPEKIRFDEGEKAGIVVSQSVMTNNGEKSAIVVTSSLGWNVTHDENDEPKPGCNYFQLGIVNPGESYVSYEDGKWYDWSDEIIMFNEETEYCCYLAYDNIPIKAYGFPAED